jgi:hypothetical protein
MPEQPGPPASTAIMAIYRFTAKLVKRTEGRRVVGAAAYRAGSILHGAQAHPLPDDAGGQARAMMPRQSAPRGNAP